MFCSLCINVKPLSFGNRSYGSELGTGLGLWSDREDRRIVPPEARLDDCLITRMQSVVGNVRVFLSVTQFSEK